LTAGVFKTDLIEDCKKGKRKAQLKLYNKYCDAMLRIAMRYLKQQDLAEDAVQEAFIKAFKHIDSFSGDVTFGAWLKRIVINQSIDYCRQLKYYDPIDENKLEMIDEERNSWEVEDQLTTADVENCIENLPENYATVLKLYLMEGYDHEEIGEILNIKANNSRILLHRGKNELKKHLKTLKHERFA
jgi:RNA polymerase sigma-70 factor (ECF subfamily)